jgi:hypothetical protein
MALDRAGIEAAPPCRSSVLDATARNVSSSNCFITVGAKTRLNIARYGECCSGRDTPAALEHHSFQYERTLYAPLPGKKHRM